MGLLGMIRKGVENKPENLNMLCINPQCVYILNIAFKVGPNSPSFFIQKKEKKLQKMELRMIRSSSQFPYEEIKQVCLEEKYVKKTVNYKIVGIVQK